MNDIVERLRNIAVNVRNNTPKGILSTTTIYEDALEALAERDATIARLKQERDEAHRKFSALRTCDDCMSDAMALAARATTAERERDKASEALKLTLAALRDVFPTEKIRTAIIAARLVLTQKAETE